MGECKVDILMMTYNHGSFIAQAIESILNQKTNFDYRLIIGEDCSSDNTLKICQEYAQKFPDKILLVNQVVNIGHHKNFVHIYNLTSTPYIALCEGDDYWTDEHKLQAQVDFLESHPDFIICFHPVEEISNDGSKKISNQGQKQVTDIEDLINGWYMNTASYVFRNQRRIHFPEWFFKAKATDLCFHILIAEHGGKIFYIDRIMAAYRRHGGGITDEKAGYIYHLRKNIPFYKDMINYFKTNNPNYVYLAEKKLYDIKNRLFYQIRYKKNKSFSDWVEMIQLGFHVKTGFRFHENN